MPIWADGHALAATSCAETCPWSVDNRFLDGGVVAPGHNLLVQPVLLVLISVVFRLLPYQFILPLLPQLLVKIHQVLLMLPLGALN